MATPNLGISHIAAAQNQPEVTANAAFDALDDSINLEVSIAITDADATLTQAQLASGGAIVITGALTANRHLNLPASIGRSFMLKNATTGGHSLIVQVTGAPGTTATIAAPEGLVELYSDGTNVTQLTAGSAFAAFGTPVENEIVAFGTGTAGTLANVPSGIAGYTQVKLYRSGERIYPGAADGYTWTGAEITLAIAAVSSDVYLADYWK